jgi:hypothetical protein
VIHFIFQQDMLRRADFPSYTTLEGDYVKYAVLPYHIKLQGSVAHLCRCSRKAFQSAMAGVKDISWTTMTVSVAPSSVSVAPSSATLDIAYKTEKTKLKGVFVFPKHG